MLRHFNFAFLQFDFELAVVYVPTAIAGLVLVSLKTRR